MKIKDLTILEFIEIARKHEGDCENCPFRKAKYLECDNVCNLPNFVVENIKKDLDLNVDIPLIDIRCE